MVVKVLKMQISSMLRKKETVLTFFIVMAFMFVNFYYNMYLNYKVGNISQMRDFVKMLTPAKSLLRIHFLRARRKLRQCLTQW